MGNQLSHRLANGQYSNYTYDALNRLRQISYFDGQSVVYTYTATGKRQAVQDNRGVTSYSYDGRDRVTLVTQPASSNSLTVTYGYDAASNRTSMGTKAGTNLYIYTDTYRLWKVYDPANGVAVYNYDPVGLRNQLALPNGVNVAYGYDSLNRLINITQTNSTSTLATYAYQLGAAGNRLKVDEAGGSSYQWAYDDGYRLISETYKASVSGTPTTTQYSYDPVGNRLSLKVNSNPATSYNYNLLDQLTSAGTTNYYYDNRGNLIRQGDGANATNYQWDAADRLAKVTLPGATTVANYKYDADGRRVQQQIVTSTTSTIGYLWDAFSTYGDVVLETDGSGNVQTSYVLANCGCSTGAELISQKKGAVTQYFLMDGQGSVRNLTDNTGNLVSGQSYRYDAFGNLQSGQTSLGTNYLYIGQQFDVLNGLYDLRARYYNPSDGRFLTRDTYPVNFNNPIELDRYGYTANNPINFADPSGLLLGESALGSGYHQKSSTVPLAQIGVETAQLVVVLLAAQLISFAKQLADEAKAAMDEAKAFYAATLAQALNPQDGGNFAVAVAFAKVQGKSELFITLSDFYLGGRRDVYGALGTAAIRSLAQRVAPDRFRGGNLAASEADAKHAEIHMIELLQQTANLDTAQTAFGGVSQGICGVCVSNGIYIRRRYPVGVLYDIDANKSQYLFLAAQSIVPRGRR